jgi:gluconolactonase
MMTFFDPPRRVETTGFTRLPDQFRKPRRTAWADANQGGRDIDSFLEGPSFDRLGQLYVTDIPYGRIFRVSPQGNWELVTEYEGWPNGLKIHRDGRVFITDYKRGIMLLDPASGAVTPFLETAASESFKGVNDLIFAPSGNLYFTDQGQTGMQILQAVSGSLRPKDGLPAWSTRSRVRMASLSIRTRASCSSR